MIRQLSAGLRFYFLLPSFASTGDADPLLIDAKILTGNVMCVKTDERRMSRSDQAGLGKDDDRRDKTAEPVRL